MSGGRDGNVNRASNLYMYSYAGFAIVPTGHDTSLHLTCRLIIDDIVSNAQERYPTVSGSWSLSNRSVIDDIVLGFIVAS